MHQTLHIFKKDVLYLWREISLLVALAVVLFWLGAGIRGDAADALGVLVATAAGYTIARLIHAEAIPGEKQFWITRPYRWQSLLAAKLLFILAFIHLPFLLAQAAILIGTGFPFSSIIPGLLWTQCLLLICVTLPLAVIAALTDSLATFFGVILQIALIALGLFWFSHKSFLSTPESMEWLSDLVGYIALALLVPPVLYLQYRLRQTRFARTLAVSLAACGLCAYLFISWQTLFPLQSRLSVQKIDVQLQHTSDQSLEFRRDDRGLRLMLPLVVTGVPDGAEIQTDSYAASLQTADGHTVWLHDADLVLKRAPDGFFIQSLRPELPQFLLDNPHQPLTLRASFYLTVFGNSRERTITLRRHPSDTMDGVRCFAGHLNQLECISAFRWPARIVSQKSGLGSTPLTRLISYSPFPSNLDLDPVARRGTQYYSRDPLPEDRPVTIEVKEPLAYLHRDVEVRNLYLDAP